MRYAKQSVVCFVLAAFWGAASGAHAQCCPEKAMCDYPGWYASGDALFLHRSRVRQQTLVVADNGTINNQQDDAPVLDARDIDFIDFETGYRVEIGRALGHGLALEGSYFEVSEWDQSIQATANGMITNDPLLEGLSPPLDNFRAFYRSNPFDAEQAGTFYQALQQTVTYQSDLRSAELNLKASWQHCQFSRSEFFGVRYLQVRERFSLVSQDEVTSTPTNGIGSYNVDCDNDLVGAQYGQEFGVTLLGRVLLSTRIKAGLFVDTIEQRTNIIDNNVLRFENIDYESELAFVGELNVGMNVKITEMLSVRGGYNLLWVEGVALAAEQDYPIAFTAVSPTNDNGGLFYHGFNVGVQLQR